MSWLFVGKHKVLPLFFKPLLWSYDFLKIDPEKHKETIIVNAINYGNLKHWRWLIENYGREEVRVILRKIPQSELRPGALRLASVMFSINDFSHASRGIKR